MNEDCELKDEFKLLEDIFKKNGYTEQMIDEVKRINEATEISDFIDNLEEERSNW